MIGVIDYGAGNIKSVLNALNFVDSKNNIKLITAPQELAKCHKLILPGLGAFKDAMDKLNKNNLTQVCNYFVKRAMNLANVTD